MLALGPAIALSGLCLASVDAASADQLRPRVVAPKRFFGTVRQGMDRTDRLIVKFREGTQIRLRGERLISLDPAVDIRGLSDFLNRHPQVTVSRHFRRSEEALDLAQAQGQARSGCELANLNLYYRFHLQESSDPVALAQSVVDELNSLPLVEIAFAEPIPELAVILGDDHGVMGRSPDLVTPDFSELQGYIYESPSGINAEAVWGYPGGRGADVKLIDIEGAWLWTHEDLIDPFFEGGQQVQNIDWRNHGTAVMAEMVGQDNGYGVIGIASDMQVGAVSIETMSVAEAIDMAAANIDPGDIFLIELHAAGPNATGGGQYGFVSVEWWQDNFDAIQTAWANGRICVEAGGNGEQDLDAPEYHGLYDRNVRYSGAIMVGAGTPEGLDAEWFTNYGSRIDLQGWGSSVTTCGYGTLQGGSEETWYTSSFGGTSSASPIVCGAVASLQGMSKAHYDITLDTQVILEILSSSGTPYNGSKAIGPRPDLVDARYLLLLGVGTISGTIRDVVSGDPIAGASIQLIEAGKSVFSDENGAYWVPVRSTQHTVRVESFYHWPNEQVRIVGNGGHITHDVNLAPRALGSLLGRVSSEDADPLDEVRITFPGTPIPDASTSLDGSYGVNDIPEGSHAAIFGLSPGHGASYRTFSIFGGQSTPLNVTLVDAEAFEEDNGGFTGTSPWDWGTPGSVGPPGAFSGEKLWATGLDSNYPNRAEGYLMSPSFDFNDAEALFLTFTHWYDTESSWDGGQVQVRDGETWVTVEPLGGYPQAALAGLDWNSGYSGSSDGWEVGIVDLTEYICADVQVRFWFGSDGAVVGPGWYIDDVAFESRGPASSAPDAAGLATRILLEPARPNPFSHATELRLQLPASSDLGVRVYSASGRRVRSLHNGPTSAGSHVLVWDGRDEQGRETPAGAYFYRIEVNGKMTATGRLLRIR